jgi:hypothetical protein
MKKDNNEQRPEAYPRPTEKDSQLQNNAEFIDQQPNDFRDKSISDLPVNDEIKKSSNEPEREND